MSALSTLIFTFHYTMNNVHYLHSRSSACTIQKMCKHSLKRSYAVQNIMNLKRLTCMYFISGVPTCSTFFQIYLLDALARWNEATTVTSESLKATSSFLQDAVNQLEEEVFQKKVLSTTSTSKYTGKLHTNSRQLIKHA